MHALDPRPEGQPLAWGRELEGLWPPAAGRSRGSRRRPWSCGQLRAQPGAGAESRRELAADPEHDEILLSDGRESRGEDKVVVSGG